MIWSEVFEMSMSDSHVPLVLTVTALNFSYNIKKLDQFVIDVEICLR